MLRCVRQSLRENIGVFDTLGGGGGGGVGSCFKQGRVHTQTQ